MKPIPECSACGYRYISLGTPRHGRVIAHCKVCNRWFVINLETQSEELNEAESLSRVIIQICDEQQGRLEYQRKIINVLLNIMKETNDTIRKLTIPLGEYSEGRK